MFNDIVVLPYACSARNGADRNNLTVRRVSVVMVYQKDAGILVRQHVSLRLRRIHAPEVVKVNLVNVTCQELGDRRDCVRV
jgi:hypothetical protein